MRMPMKRFCLLACLGFALVACGSQGQAPSMGQVFAQSITQRLPGRSPAASPTAAAPQISRAQFAAVTSSVLLVTLDGGQQATVVQVARNGPTQTYLSADDISLSVQNGVLVATRGFGSDLMQADVAGVLAALRAGGGRYSKTLSQLDGLDQMRDTVLACTLTARGSDRITILGQDFATRLFAESCTAGGINLASQYWMQGGQMVKSQQWVVPESRPLTIELIK